MEKPLNLSIYQSDYAPPHIKTSPPKAPNLICPSNVTLTADQPQCKACVLYSPLTCGDDDGNALISPANVNCYEWSRLGPLGPFLDPKLYYVSPREPMRVEPVKCRDKLTTELENLKEKCPYFYDVFKNVLQHESVNKSEDERMITIYQQDYTVHSDPCSERTTAYEDIMSCLGMPDRDKVFQQLLQKAKCPPKKSSRGKIYRKDPDAVQCKKYKSKSRQTPAYKGGQDGEEGGTGSKAGSWSAKSWASEYVDSIAKTGANIIRDKLHCPVVDKYLKGKDGEKKQYKCR